MAALSSKTSRLHWSLTRSTNKEDFLEFLKLKIHPFVKYPRSTVLIMDNHRAHHSTIVTEWLKQKNYVVHFLPPYSSELNPIETAWAILKKRWAKQLHDIEFEDKMFKINNTDTKALRNKKKEFDYDSDGEIILTTKQKLSQRELERELVNILEHHMTQDRLKKISKGCKREMMKVMMLASEQEKKLMQQNLEH